MKLNRFILFLILSISYNCMLTFGQNPKYHILKGNVYGNNILLQDSLNAPHTKYIIKYDFDLNNKTLHIPEFCELIFQGGSLTNGNLKLSSHVKIENGKFYYKGDGSLSKSIIRVHDVENVEIINCEINGGYVSGKDGEWSHGIDIQGSKNILIENCYIYDTYGDNIYLGRSYDITKNINKEIKIVANKLGYCRRCNIAIVCAENVMVENNLLIDNSDYVACIDIEPNNNSIDYVKNITIIKNNSICTKAVFITLSGNNLKRINDNINIISNKANNRIFLRGNSGVELYKNVTIAGNEINPQGEKDNRAFLIRAHSNFYIKDNKINIQNYISTPIVMNSVSNTFFENNSIVIPASNKIGMVFDIIEKSNNILIANNTFDCYTADGCLSFNRNAKKQITMNGINIDSNTFKNARYAIRINCKLIKSTINNNIFDSSERNIMLSELAKKSEIKITSSNKFLKNKTPVYGIKNIENY